MEITKTNRINKNNISGVNLNSILRYKVCRENSFVYFYKTIYVVNPFVKNVDFFMVISENSLIIHPI